MPLTETQSKRLNSSPTDPAYLLRRILTHQIRDAIRSNLSPGGGARVLDIGCGSRPYEHLFEGYASRYVGVDWEPRDNVDVVASGEDLPMDDGSFDCVLCSQVIEHVRYPHRVVSEIGRVLRPGGVALLSTHGVIRYHANPDDYWRWTHSGLHELFHQNGTWQRVSVLPNGGTGVAIGYLLQWEGVFMANRAGLKQPWKMVTSAGNAAIWNIERVYRRLARNQVPSLAPNYLVVAIR